MSVPSRIEPKWPANGQKTIAQSYIVLNLPECTEIVERLFLEEVSGQSEHEVYSRTTKREIEARLEETELERGSS